MKLEIYTIIDISQGIPREDCMIGFPLACVRACNILFKQNWERYLRKVTRYR